ncbi:MAG: type II toxin-antitoxin system PemK/MazF family toxin [Planctomycetes bacterium]|nr:type II toxin-antitoxin system PemK/MazF family toxin [Planctomycetota bacterium]
MTRGEVYWAVLEPRSGSEQRGRRPVLVVSHDIFNRSPGWRSVIVVPLSTSSRQSARGPTAVLIPGRAGGLPHDSIALCHQVTTLDRGKMANRAGVLPGPLLQRVEAGLKMAMSLT